MKKIKFLYFYYALILFSEIHDSFLLIRYKNSLFNPPTMEISLYAFILLSVGWILFFLSLIIIILTYRKKLPNFAKFFPIYYSIIFLIWFKFVPIITLFFTESIENGIEILNILFKYNLLLHIFNICFAIYIVIRINKEK